MGAVKVKSGDRVRVVLEGEVRKHPLNRGTFIIGSAGHANYVIQDAAHVVSVEVLEPAVETFKPGDVLQSLADATRVTLGKGGFLDHEDREWYEDEAPFTSRYWTKVELIEKPF